MYTHFATVMKRRIAAPTMGRPRLRGVKSVTNIVCGEDKETQAEKSVTARPPGLINSVFHRVTFGARRMSAC